MDKIDPDTMIRIEAAAFRALRHHLMVARPDVQNIDLMNMAGFCRNCLARWVQEAAADEGVDLSKDAARELYYGLPYDAWRAQHQTAADAAKQAAFAVAFEQNVGKAD